MRWVLTFVVILTVVNLGILTWQLLPDESSDAGQRNSPLRVPLGQPDKAPWVIQGEKRELEADRRDLERRLMCLELASEDRWNLGCRPLTGW